MTHRSWLVGAVMPLLGALVFAQDKDEVQVTIYNQDLGVVKEKRFMELKEGTSSIQFKDVAALIDPTSVHFKSLTSEETKVLEQDYEYDLVSAEKLLHKYVDRELTVMTKDGKSYSGTLLSYDGNQIILAEKSGEISMIQRQDNVKDLHFSKLPEGLLTRPTLLWQIDSKRGGKHQVEVTYMTGGMNWHVDYTAVADKDDKFVDLAGWVTLDNRSGTSYRDAKIKLVAGDVHRSRGPVPSDRGFEKGENARPQVEERSFFEYHLYELKDRTTLKDNEIKQVELLNVQKVPVQKTYVFTTQDTSRGTPEAPVKARVYLEFKNNAQNHLGMALPMGKIRAFKADDKDGSKEFVGEDAVGHTPKDEKVKILVGNAFDVVADRKTVSDRSSGRHRKASYEVRFRNHKSEDIQVTLRESLGTNWEITEESVKSEKKDAYTVEYLVDVKKDAETVLKFTVEWNW